MKTMTVIFPPGRNVQEIILPLSHRQRNGTEPGIATWIQSGQSYPIYLKGMTLDPWKFKRWGRMPLVGVLSKKSGQYYSEKEKQRQLRAFLVSPCKGMAPGSLLGSELTGADLSLQCGPRALEMFVYVQDREQGEKCLEAWHGQHHQHSPDSHSLHWGPWGRGCVDEVGGTGDRNLF